MSVTFPQEFEALLSKEGRRVLAGEKDHPAVGALQRGSFLAAQGLLDTAQLPALTRLISETFSDLTVEMARVLPPANLSKVPFEDTLPKVGSMRTVPSDGPLGFIARKLSDEIGLTKMCFSESFHRFCEALAGERLAPVNSGQVLNNRRGDYAGPHTDHHPDDAALENGYVDVHLTFCTPGVREQFIVYQRDGHLSAIEPIAVSGTITAYRLPLWHYTTPLQTSTPEDRRWLVLATFPFAPAP
ncbi:MAG: hypothetical protein JNM17_09115 [Archangium sp.]|nr:hypothetical protein [Archangium sp.]